MELQEARDRFINSWGTLGSSWGISKTMAQVHALLMVSEDELSTEDVMEALNISRGNANMNLRALIDWGLVEKKTHMGERKEFFVGEKDMWKVATWITQERRKRELEPILKVLEEVKEINPKSGEKKDIQAFQKQMKKLQDFTQKADKLLNRFTRADERWFTSVLMRLIK